MTKKEIQYVEKKIKQYEKWAENELKKYEETGDKENWDQYRFNEVAMDAIILLMQELSELKR